MVLPVIGKGGILKYICLGILSGLCSFLFINMVTRVVSLLITGNFTAISKEYIVIFIAIILVFIWTRRTLALAISYLSQRIFWNIRKQILVLVLKANYQQLSGRKDKIHAAIVNDVGALTNASLSVIDFFIAIIMSLSCFVYLLSISWVLFVITLAVTLSGIAVYFITSKANMHGFQRARSMENEFQENFNAILDGFKEIYMEPKKGKYINEEKISRIAEASFKNNITALTGFINNSITGQVLFYVLISSVLLCFSITLKIPASDTVSFVFTLIYLLGSIQTIMVLLPTLIRAGVATNQLMELKQELEEGSNKQPVPDRYVFRHIFEQLTITNLLYRYEGEEAAFSVGPVNLEIRKGDIIFIYGGNGSGKTTLIHNLLGLCLPAGGEIRLNAIPVADDNYPDYRALFSVVFSDFYLFKEILGVDRFDRDRCQYYLRLFELEGKVTVEGKTFSTTELSTGQRKRLALIATLLEGKPILVIDEWAADQDPYFRKKFYTEILPLLKLDGITVVAITHDDKYYHCADRLFKMADGKLLEEKNPFHPAGINGVAATNNSI
jgi:putative ATP-binding cassette transporter